MVLTRTTGNAVDNYLTAIEANGSTPVHYVEIDIDGTNKFRFVSGDRPLFTDQSDGPYANSVIAVQPIDATLDPLKREYQVGSADIIFADDGEIRRINQTHRLYGKKVEIKLTEQSLAENTSIAFANRTVFQGVLVIHDVVPQENGTISVTCEGWNALNNLGRSIRGEYINQHPLEIIESLIDVGGTLSSSYLDRTTLDPQYSAHSDITHYNCSAVNLHARVGASHPAFYEVNSAFDPDTDFKARDQINDLLFLLQAGFRQGADGQVRLFRYNPSASVARQLTSDDIKSFQQVETYADLTNKVTVNMLVHATKGHANAFQQKDTTSISSYALPGETERINEQLTASQFMNGIGVLWNSSTGTEYLKDGAVWVDIRSPIGYAGFCGARFNGSTDLTVPSWARLSSTKRLILQLWAAKNVGGRVEGGRTVTPAATEVIACSNLISSIDGVVTPSGRGVEGPDRAGPELPGTVTKNYPRECRLTIHERGMYGTKKPGATATGDAASITTSDPTGWALAAGAGQTRAYDITMAADFIDKVLARFSHGCPRARIVVGLGQYDLELGDFITVADSTYLNHQQDGADGTVVWEIIGKEISLDSGEITLDLAWVRDGVAPATSVVVEEEADAVPTGMVAYTGPTVNDFGLPKTVIATDVSLITDALGDLIVTKG